MPRELAIEIASDVICPWCYIGKRRLEKALTLINGETSGSAQPALSWLPFELNPDMPVAGMPRAEYRRAKFGSPERARQLDARVVDEGRTAGIEFAFERIERTPNTRAAHELIDVAQRQGKANGVVDALFRAYFEEAKDIGDATVLADIATRHEVSGWPGQARHEEVGALEEEVRRLGISAVPTFIFARRFAVSGAHPPESLAQAIRQALAEAT
jgi:predicted DsbA family dithiol-disulfide isomerase